jgi:hypothetical protein
MVAFVLILYIAGPYPAIAAASFESFQTCLDAGREVNRSLSASVQFACVKK